MTVTSVIVAIIVGLVIGVLGRMVAPGKQDIPLWLTVVVGVVAAFIGTAIASALDISDTKGFDFWEFIIQVIVAAVGVSLVAGVAGRNRVSR
jgi:uncharacterized membrane protein YeaQ/YmgE (transglycosylase-associated protein family)